MHDHRDGHPDDRIDSRVAVLQHEMERLRAVLAERDDALRAMRERFEHDLLQARRELAQVRGEQEQLAEELCAAHAASPAPVPVAHANRAQQVRWRPWRAWVPRSERPMQREIDLLRQSGLFDADWYLAEYPDVANTGGDPAEHYLLHGAAEGRNPGPEFNTHQYLFDHPDLIDSGENPVLHFLKSARTARPR